VCFDTRLGYWLVTRYSDVHACLRDDRLSSRLLDELMARLPAAQATASAPLREILTGRLLLTDDPDHRRIRGLMQLAFTPRRVALMKEAIQIHIDELLEQAISKGEIELIAHFADPLPAFVISHMLGLPRQDHHRFKVWTDEIYAFMGVTAEPLESRARRATESARELRDYLANLFESIRQSPRDDLLSGMVAAEEEGAKLSEEELFSNVVGMINAAHETTTNLIGNTVLNLLRHSNQWERLVADVRLAEGAVEEGLRYDSPIQMVGRNTLEEVEVAGVKIPRGQRVALLLGAANRDSSFFPEPERFDITREGNKHVAFGGGPHFCLGAALGRLEGQMAVEALSRRFPKLSIAEGQIRWRPYPVFRGLRSLRSRLQ
jgi:cytochrome P450